MTIFLVLSYTIICFVVFNKLAVKYEDFKEDCQNNILELQEWCSKVIGGDKVL